MKNPGQTMSKNYLDTNVLLRFFLKDNEKQYSQVKLWFKEAETGKRTLIVTAVVVAESCFVLESFYKKSRQDISRVMQVFLSQRWLRVEERQALLNVWEDYGKNMHFVDAYLKALATVNEGGLLTFDKKLAAKV